MTRLARFSSAVLRLVGAMAALAMLGALLVGVPWGLITFIGWPLPDHVPTLDEVEATLLNPLSVTLLLDMLACIAWPIWLVFAVDVARCVPDAARGARPPAIGPVHAVAAVLVATALLGLAHPRPSTAHPQAPPEQPVSTVTTSRTDLPLSSHASTAPVRADEDTLASGGEAIVRPPRAGVHDSLWRVAERELGDGQRWVELFRLNEGRPQPDGGVLTDPHMVRPHWVLHLPDAPQTAPEPPPPPSATADPSPEPAPTRPGAEAERQGERAPTPHAVSATPGTAIALWSGGLVAATLAGAVTFAMVTRRRKRLRSYKPGSGDRTPPPTPAPAVHALHLAYDEAHLDDEPPDTDAPNMHAGRGSPPTSREQGPDGDSRTAVAVGVVDERARALDLAAARGLGLTGAGAEAAARSLLVHLVATTSAHLVVTADAARALLGEELPTSTRLNVADDLANALTQVENRCLPDALAPGRTTLNTVVVAATTTADARLQSILDTGADRGVGGILLGHWPAGATVRVRGDGIVAAASPSLDDLRGARLFHLDATDTRDLLALFADAPAMSTPSPDPGVHVEKAHASTSSSARGAPDETGEQSDDEAALQRGDLDATTDEDGERRDVEPMTPNEQNAPIDDHTSVPADAHTPYPPSPPAGNNDLEHPQREYELSILGPVTLTWHGSGENAVDLTSTLAPKHRALLVLLALHPQGTTREAIREALWPDARGRRPFNAFYATLSQLRKALTNATGDTAAEIITHDGEHVSLNPDLVEVDYWQLHEAEHQRHTSTSDEDRMAAWSRIAAAYRGELADGMSALWLEGPREAAHRAVVDALTGMAAHYREHDPQRQLQLLEHARLLNPENEAIYRDIMRVQAQLGYIDAISRTVQLLTTALGEIGERPDPGTLTLARALQARHQRAAS